MTLITRRLKQTLTLTRPLCCERFTGIPRPYKRLGLSSAYGMLLRLLRSRRLAPVGGWRRSRASRRVDGRAFRSVGPCFRGIRLGKAVVHELRLCLFFFQAEDGIRDLIVTGVQTCALPISFAPAAPPVSQRDSTVLRVLAINDFHGALEARIWPWSDGRPVGGAAALKPWLDSLARACGCTTVRLDGGDEMQGTLLSNFSFGLPAIATLNAFGIDAATITAPRNVRGLAFGDGAAAVRRVLPRARAAADFVIVVAHEGAFCDGAPGPDPVPAGACHGEIVDIARGLDSGTVDLIVRGHTHSLVNTVVHGIPIVQARSSGAGIAVVDFVRVRGTERQVRARIETPYADQVRPDAALADTLRPYQRDIETVTGRSVARIKTELRRGGEED